MNAPRLKLIPAEDARRILFEIPTMGHEQVPLGSAAGRVLAEPLIAPHDLPADARAAMDGYAVRAEDVARASKDEPVTLRVVGSVPAGGVFLDELGPGAAVEIATGAVLPDRSDAVVMVEDTEAERTATAEAALGRVRVFSAVPRGAHVVQPGEDLRSGVPVLPAGRQLRPHDISALAAFGVTRVTVFKRPRIAVLSTGSELVPPEENPKRGQVRDVNLLVLTAQIESTGAAVLRGGIAVDDAGHLRDAIAELLDDTDGLILSGGSSIGFKDLTGKVLRDLGEPGVLFHGIDIRPGKPTVYARAGRKPIIGMPGYPTSSMVVFEAFVRPMLARMGGQANHHPWPARLRARLAGGHVKPSSREDYLRVRLVARDGQQWADPIEGGSSAISNMLFADGLVRVPAGIEQVPAGAEVDVRAF